MQGALTKVSGVTSVSVSLPDKAVVKIEKDKASVAELTAAVKRAGFSAVVKQ